MMWLHGPNFIKSLNVKVNEITPDGNSLITDVYSEELLYGETMVNVISQPIEHPKMSNVINLEKTNDLDKLLRITAVGYQTRADPISGKTKDC